MPVKILKKEAPFFTQKRGIASLKNSFGQEEKNTLFKGQNRVGFEAFSGAVFKLLFCDFI